MDHLPETPMTDQLGLNLKQPATLLRRLVAAGPVDERFDRERDREQSLLLPHRRLP